MKSKKRIWKNKYIDFADLLSPHEHQQRYSLSLENNTFSSKPSLQFTQKSKKPLSEIQWGMAWDTFMSVYLKKRPEESEQLVTYHQNVQKRMSRGANWRIYDSQFRIDREYDQCRWDTVRIDLERDAYYNNNKKTSSNTPQTSTNNFQDKQYKNNNNTPVPKGYCYAYSNQSQRICYRDTTKQ